MSWKNLINDEEPEVGQTVLVYDQWNDEYKIYKAYRCDYDGKIHFSNDPNIFPKTTGTFWMELPEKPNWVRPPELDFEEEINKIKEQTQEEDTKNKIPKLRNYDSCFKITEKELLAVMKNLNAINVDGDCDITPIPLNLINHGTITLCGRTFKIEKAAIKLNTIFPEHGEVVCELDEENEKYITKWFEMIAKNIQKTLSNINVRVRDYEYYEEFTDWDKYCELQGIINARTAEIDTDDGYKIVLNGVHPLSVQYDRNKKKKVIFIYDYATVAKND